MKNFTILFSPVTVCAESLLETMTDLSSEFLLQFGKHLRKGADNLAMNEPSGFPVRNH